MAQVLKGGVVLVNGYDLSCYLQSMNETADVEMLDSTAICTTGGRSFKPGLTSRSFSGEAFWSVGDISDDGTLTPNEAANVQNLIKSSLGSQNGFHKITSGVEGATAGAKAVLYNADAAKGSVSTKIGELLMISFDATAGVKSNVPAFQDGNWLYYGTTAQEVTAASVDKQVGATGYFLRVHNAGNKNGVSYQVEHSTNNTTWVAFESGTVAANSVVEEFSTVTAINRYVRVVVNSPNGESTIGVAFVHGYEGVV